jgi:hypothetical protein
LNYLDMVGVTGSIPVARTIQTATTSLPCRQLWNPSEILEKPERTVKPRRVFWRNPERFVRHAFRPILQATPAL